MADGLEGPVYEALLAAAHNAGFDLAAAVLGSETELRATDVAQPALLLVELALSSALPDGLEVVGVAGHSVGEYAAAAVAGAIASEDAMRLVVERGRAMASAREGVMSALIGIDADAVGEICAEVTAEGHGDVVIANYNGPAQLVISGAAAAVASAEDVARTRGARRVVRLNVGGAFHSPLMRDAAARFTPLLDATLMRDPTVPVVCNVDATAVSTAAPLRARLRDQLTSAVRWTDSVARLIELGAETLIEVGPQSVLTGLAKRIAPSANALSVSTVAQARAVGSTVGVAG